MSLGSGRALAAMSYTDAVLLIRTQFDDDGSKLASVNRMHGMPATTALRFAYDIV